MCRPLPPNHLVLTEKHLLFYSPGEMLCISASIRWCAQSNILSNPNPCMPLVFTLFVSFLFFTSKGITPHYFRLSGRHHLRSHTLEHFKDLVLILKVLVQSSFSSKSRSKIMMNQTIFDVPDLLVVNVLLLTHELYVWIVYLPPSFLVSSVWQSMFHVPKTHRWGIPEGPLFNA